MKKYKQYWAKNFGIIFLSFFFFLDRILKLLILQGFYYNFNFYNFLNLKITLFKNKYLAFSLFFPVVWIIVLSFIFLLIILFLFFREKDDLNKLSFSLIFLGGLSNFLDRLFYGFVIDYFHLTFLHFSFPIFNLSDVFIVIGILIFLKNFLLIKG